MIELVVKNNTEITNKIMLKSLRTTAQLFVLIIYKYLKLVKK